MVMNFNSYLNEEELSRGADKDTQNIVSTFLALSTPTQYLDMPAEEQLRGIILGSVRDGAYCGVFHIIACANILKQTVVLVYPTYGGAVVYHRMLCRAFLPRAINQHPSLQRTTHILFTNVAGVTVAEDDFKVDHFCVMMQR